MEIRNFLVNITSENPDRLKEFYRETVGLTPNPEMGDGAFQLLPGAVLAIDGHSETKGATREPQRVLIDFMVEDLDAEQARLQAKGVQFIRDKGKEEWGGTISTFLDPDGNYCQLIEYHPGA